MKLIYQVTFEVNTNLQIIKISTKDLDSICLYRSRTKSLIETSLSIRNMIDLSKATLITGDFNICLLQSPSNTITSSLHNLGFKQLICEATHILGNLYLTLVFSLFFVLGGHIDHVYWRDPNHIMKDPILELYSPYYSDHDAILITINPKDRK